MPTPTEKPSPHHLRAELLLLFITLLWGSTFTATKLALNDLGVYQLLALRFSIAALLALVWFGRSIPPLRTNQRQWRHATWLGSWLAVGYIVQTLGLQTTTAPRSAFITQLLVIGVPLLQIGITRRLPSRGVMAAIAVALVGLVLLTEVFTPKAQGGSLSGDVLTLVCAFTWSVYILELARLSREVHLSLLVFVPCALIAVLCWVCGAATSNITWEFGWDQWAIILYLGILCTFLTTLIQSRFQRDTTPTRTALIFCAEPVFASIIAWVGPLHEILTPLQLVGAVLILLGIVLTELL